MLPAISVNKGCCSHLRLQALLTLSAKGTQDGNKDCPPSSRRQDCSLRKLRILAPESWGAYQRNDFSEPRLLHLPIHRKALNSLTWVIWFSLINNNLFTFRLPALCCKNSYILQLPPHLRGAVFSELFEMLSPGLEVLRMSAKYNITLNF